MFRKFLFSISIIITLISSGAWASCESYIEKAEKENGIPPRLLKSISEVESGFNPYALNIAGKPYHAKTIAEAKAVIQDNLNKGTTNIDIGCMQLNYKYHAKNFSSLDEMLDVSKNVKYAASHLRELYDGKGKKVWHTAVAFYHSANKKYQSKYTHKIMVSWLKKTVSRS